MNIPHLTMAISIPLLLLVGCSEEKKVIHTLGCVLHSVVKVKSGEEVVFTRENAIKNGYSYHFAVYDNDEMIVNDTDVYVKEIKASRSYVLKIDENIISNMQFQFSKSYDDVIFMIRKRNEQYTYDCTVGKQ